jgi:DNA polymerase-3 subunit epsilon
MELKLKRPLVFFDLETTGVNVATDRIVEVSFLKVMPNGEETVYTKKINPEMPIPAESSFFMAFMMKM